MPALPVDTASGTAPDRLLVCLPLFDGLAADGRLAWRSGNAAIRDSLLNILLTRPGERLMRPGFGAGLRNFIHSPNNETTRALIADAARRALARWEPRIHLDEVQVVSDPERLAQVHVSIRYRLRSSGQHDTLDLALALDLG